MLFRSSFECPLCSDLVEQCDECGDFPVINEDWYCYNDGDKHYCELCWIEYLRKQKEMIENENKEII